MVEKESLRGIPKMNYKKIACKWDILNTTFS